MIDEKSVLDHPLVVDLQNHFVRVALERNELLEALEAVISDFYDVLMATDYGYTDEFESIMEARAAIAKARGK